MRRLKARLCFPLLALTLLSITVLSGQDQPALAPPSNMVVAKGIPGVVAAGTPILIVKTGFEGAEGPVGANHEDGEYLLAFDVRPDGTLANRRNFARYESVKIPGHNDPRFAEGNGADGLAIDGEGRGYAATNRGVEVFSPQGRHLGTIPVIWGVE